MHRLKVSGNVLQASSSLRSRGQGCTFLKCSTSFSGLPCLNQKPFSNSSMEQSVAHRSAARYDRSNTIGFIGLGAMGNHMLNNLVINSAQKNNAARPEFVIFDISDKAIKQVIQRHQEENPTVKVTTCPSPSEVAKRASTIITMVPTGKHVQDVYLGDNSVMSALKELPEQERKATLCLDQSTIEQSVSKAVALKMRAINADMLDAPVSGGVVGARDGTLTIMVGGDKEAFKRSLPVLEPMARKVTHCGDLGTGLAAKIANKYVPAKTLKKLTDRYRDYSMLLGITMLGLSEAMNLGKKLGVECQVLADIINNSTGRCWSSEVNHPVPKVTVGTASPPAHRNYEGGFLTKLAHKDLALAVAVANQNDIRLELGKRVEEVYRPLAKSEKWGNLDFSVVYELLANPVPPESTAAKL